MADHDGSEDLVDNGRSAASMCGLDKSSKKKVKEIKRKYS